MADYRTLDDRYKKIRACEDIDDMSQPSTGGSRSARRVRIVNYYTASTGRPKQPKAPLAFGRSECFKRKRKAG